MKTTSLLPPSPAASQGATTFLSPARTTRIVLSTRAPRLVKAARSLTALARKKSACGLPLIPVDRSHGAIVFAVMFAAAAAMIYLSALAMLGSQGAAVSEPPPPKPPRSGASFEGARRVTPAIEKEVCRFAEAWGSAVRRPPLLAHRSDISFTPVARSARGTRM